MCRCISERSLDIALEKNHVPDQGNAYQHAVDILNGICVDKHQRYQEIPEPINSFLRDLSNST